MSAPDDRAKRTTRRTSARISEKENANGVDSDAVSTATRPAKGKGAGKSSAASKRKQDYDEEDDGFLFTRTKPKKVKTTAPAIPEAIVEEVDPGVATTQSQTQVNPKKRGRKASEVGVQQDREQTRDAALDRRGTRAGIAEAQDEPAPLEIKKKRRSKAKTPEPDPATAEEAEERGRSRRIAPEARTTPGPGADVTTKIALPFADTPIIRRNQEMRRGKEGSRRSSLGNRGRRASSLIDGGRSSALPHENVESAEFFKHIESGLPEPRRMKQLLTWCATRALSGGKNKRDAEATGGKDAAVRAAAKEIQQQILKDFGIRSEMSDWFGREETEKGAKEVGPVVKKPNPKNQTNEAKIRELELQLQRLQTERSTWESLLRPPNKGPILPELPSTLPRLDSLDATLLTTSNASILKTLQTLQLPVAPTLQQETRQKLDAATQNLEFRIDQLADNVHILGQYRSVADSLATQVLGHAAMALEVRSRKERERSGTDEAGVRDVLRGLSRVEQQQQ